MKNTRFASGFMKFRLSSLFNVLGLFATFVAAILAVGAEFAQGFSGFFLAIGFVIVLVVAISPVDRIASKLPYAASLIVVPFLYCFLELAFYLFGQAIDQPHVVYASGNWFTLSFSEFLAQLPFIGISATVMVALDWPLQSSRPRDCGYYPRLANRRAVFGRITIRLPMIVALMLVLSYYAATVLEMWCSLSAALRWPPKRVYVACNFLWAIFWVADCFSRPHRGTIFAAMAFSIFVFLYVLPMGFGVLCE